MTLATERLRLREFRVTDLRRLVALIGSLAVSRYLAIVPHPYRRADGRQWISRCRQEAQRKPRRTIDLAVARKEDDRVIGVVSLFDIDRDAGTAEMGYWLGERYWGRGFMGEAAARMVRHGFARLQLERIQLHIFSANRGSLALAAKLGFARDPARTRRRACRATGRRHTEQTFVCHASEWGRQAPERARPRAATRRSLLQKASYR